MPYLLIRFSPTSHHLCREHYFASAAWVSQTEVCVVWMNRAQNLSVVTLCKSPMWYCQEVSFTQNFYGKKLLKCDTNFAILQTHKTSGDGRGWVDELAVPFFSTNVSTYIAISPVREGSFGEFSFCHV